MNNYCQIVKEAQGNLFEPARGQGSHANSREAYRSLGSARSDRTARIIAYLQAHGPATDREIAAGLGFTDMNSVRPRITEAIEDGVLREFGHVACGKTGKTVRVVDAAQLDGAGARS